MTSLRWMKMQDFCLRLGLLKALVSVMPASRTSVARAAITKKLSESLFAAVGANQQLLQAAQVASGEPDYAPRSVADALLLASDARSWGQPIERKTAYKILEWGKVAGFVATGNRITERGLILKSLFDSEAVAAFRSGDPSAWNPFTITSSERAFFAYHLTELDTLLWQLALDLGALGQGEEVSAANNRVYELLVSGMGKFLKRAEGSVSMPELPRFRVVKELYGTIAHEVQPAGTAGRSRRVPGPPSPRRPGSGRRTSRQTKKNADHQAIPRFEQLVDLGLLDKPIEHGVTGKALGRAKRAWRFTVTEAAATVAGSIQDLEASHGQEWRWGAFASALAASGVAGCRECRKATDDEALEFFCAAYKDLRRPAGHSPFESAALLAMIRALSAGRIVEMGRLHSMMTLLKRSGALENHIYFAAGNEIDRMFIVIRSGFLDAWRETSAKLTMDGVSDG